MIGFWAFGFEPKGRTFDEIDSAHDAPAPADVTEGHAPARAHDRGYGAVGGSFGCGDRI